MVASHSLEDILRHPVYAPALDRDITVGTLEQELPETETPSKVAGDDGGVVLG